MVALVADEQGYSVRGFTATAWVERGTAFVAFHSGSFVESEYNIISSVVQGLDSVQDCTLDSCGRKRDFPGLRVVAQDNLD